jgi:hypothetical protein
MPVMGVVAVVAVTLRGERRMPQAQLRGETLEKKPRVPVAVEGCSCGARGSAHGGNAAVVAVGQFLQRSALREPSGGLLPLGRCERRKRGPSHMRSSGLGAAPVSAVRVRIWQERRHKRTTRHHRRRRASRVVNITAFSEIAQR